MKKILVGLLVVSVAQGSLLLGDPNGLYEHVVGGGFDNLDEYLKNSKIPEKCLEVSRPWNQFLNAFTINNISDWHACRDLNKEFLSFQQEFLKEVREEKLVSKKEFYSKYFDDHSRGHYFKISTVFDPDVKMNGLKKKSDPKIIKEVYRYQKALKKSTKGL
jgi:hypothetical protein